MILVPEGTQIVFRQDVRTIGAERIVASGTPGVVERAPEDATHSYRIKTADSLVVAATRAQFSIRKHSYDDELRDGLDVLSDYDLSEHIVLRCIVGSRAYGLDQDDSDTDVRGVYLPPADVHWSLHGAPEQLEDKQKDECFWEIQKFIMLALKANPNILECLYTPLIEQTTEVGQGLLRIRSSFLSRIAYRTYNGYVLSQFKKLEQDLRNQGEVRWKHAMHLLRMLTCGIDLLERGELVLDVGERRDYFLSVKHGEQSWESVEARRLELHAQFETAFGQSKLPERPDYQAANDFLLRARRTALGG